MNPDSNIEVKLIRPHQHGGIFLPAGEKIKVSQSDAEWLAKYGVIADTPKQPTKQD